MDYQRKLSKASQVCFVAAALAIVAILLFNFALSGIMSGSGYEDWPLSVGLSLLLYVALPATLIGVLLAAAAGGVYVKRYMDSSGVTKKVTGKSKKKKKKKSAAKKRKK